MSRSLWLIGLIVLEVRSKGSVDEVQQAVALVPDLGDEPVGDIRLKFGVLSTDLTRMRLIATQERKAPAQLHRNALAIGLWAWERIMA